MYSGNAFLFPPREYSRCPSLPQALKEARKARVHSGFRCPHGLLRCTHHMSFPCYSFCRHYLRRHQDHPHSKTHSTCRNRHPLVLFKLQILTLLYLTDTAKKREAFLLLSADDGCTPKVYYLLVSLSLRLCFYLLHFPSDSFIIGDIKSISSTCILFS